MNFSPSSQGSGNTSETSPAAAYQPYPASVPPSADVPAPDPGDQDSSVPAIEAPLELAPVSLQVLRRVTPAYPPLARQVRTEGTVELSVEVSPDGYVRDVRIIKGPPLLTHAAVDAVRQWRY